MKSKARLAAETLLKLKQEELIEFQRKHLAILLAYQQLEKDVHELEYQLHYTIPMNELWSAAPTTGLFVNY